ncbi:MAG: alpha/beta hydrolase domain-containing protein [Candidatus Eisenbacteria bacterium]
MNRHTHGLSSELCAVLALLTVICVGLMPPEATARVVKVEVVSREVAGDWPEQSPTGSYEVIKGMIYLEVDPDDPANQLIVDLKIADRNERGKVEFSTEFELHKPVDAGRGNHRLIYFVNNRGSKLGDRMFNRYAGTNWLYDKGWSYLWCGWNCDAIQDDRRVNINVPVVRANGETITGRIYAEICSPDLEPVYGLPFYWGGSIAYPSVDTDPSRATLTMRPYRWAEPVEVPSEQWSFARLEDGEVVPDPRHLYLPEGFKPGWLYDLVYIGKDPKLTGLGFAAIRDVVSFLRYEATDDHGFANPLSGIVDYAYAFGHSQSGRVLYHYVYQDFNNDEARRIVFDGIMPHCSGGGKGQFNYRFAQTTRHGSHHEDNLYPSDFFPFTTVEQYDPLTGERGDGLARVRKSGFLPKMMFINTSTDYWTRAASLLHTDVDGKKDAAIDPNVRMYFLAGLSHGHPRCGYIDRALLTALDLWVSQGVEPPESELPKISDGSLVSLETYLSTFPEVPWAETPESFFSPYRLDPGPRWQTEGTADNVPPEVGPRYVCLVPQVNEDGNEIAGIQLPVVAVPVATRAGWYLRPDYFPAPGTLTRWSGRSWPFPRSEEEREEHKDPRPSILKRYPTKADYLAEVAECLLELHRRRFLLPEDVTILLNEAAEQDFTVDALPYYGPPKIPVYVVLMEEEKVNGLESTISMYHELKKSRPDDYDFSEDQLNSLGYTFLNGGKLTEALAVFNLNIEMFPDASNPYDSYAEACMVNGDYDKAITYYNKSLELNPDNTNATMMLDEIDRRIKAEETGR